MSQFRVRWKNKLSVFLPLLLSFLLFLFICLNFTNSVPFVGNIEKETAFFANVGDLTANLASLDRSLTLYSKLESDRALNEFVEENLKAVLSSAAKIQNERGEQLSEKIHVFIGKIKSSTKLVMDDSDAEERVSRILLLKDEIATFSAFVNLASKQRLELVKSGYLMWHDFLNRTVVVIAFLFLLICVVQTWISFKYSNKISKLSSMFSLPFNAGIEKFSTEISNITENKNAQIEELVKKCEREQILGKRREDLLNAIPEGLVTAIAGKIAFVNKAMKKWFGVENSAVGEDLKSTFEKFQICNCEGKFSVNGEIYFMTVFNNQNETFYIIRNITDSEELSNRLLNSERLASIGEMAARITHEIRNPLNTIKLNSNYLAENIDKIEHDNQKNLLSLIIGEVERLEQITNKYMNMVNYSKNEQSENNVSLPEDLIEFLSFHLPELQKRNIELNVGKTQPLFLAISQSSFKEIILNLLKNSWEELQNGGKIAVNIENKGSFAAISVEDSGSGIPVSERETIFKNFYTKKPGGTGIGLSHSRKLAVGAGGKLYVKDSELGGAAFVLEIPIKKKS